MRAETDTLARARRCLVTGQTADSADLLRFVIAPDGNVVPDIAARLPGRGYWVTATRTAVDEAVRRHLFVKAAARAGKTRDGAGGGAPGRVVVAETLGQQVDTLLVKSCLDLLGLARRAGLVVTGFEKVRESLSGDPRAVLVTATDGSLDGRAKLVRGDREVVAVFSRDELSLALGRENVVHAALTPTGIARRFMTVAARLAHYRGADDADDDAAPKRRNAGTGS